MATVNGSQTSWTWRGERQNKHTSFFCSRTIFSCPSWVLSCSASRVPRSIVCNAAAICSCSLRRASWRFFTTHINLERDEDIKNQMTGNLGAIYRTVIEVKHHVYVKRQTRICTTWPSFPFTCCLLFIISTLKLLVSRNVLSRGIVLSCFYLLIFYFQKFSTWIWRLPFAVYVKLKLSNFSKQTPKFTFCVTKETQSSLDIYSITWRKKSHHHY